MQRSVGGYVRGNLLISLLASIGAFAAMSVLGVPYALPLALAVGLLDIIPLIGATLGAVLCVLVALSVGWLAAVLLIVYFVVYQQTENHVLAPVIYAKTVAMSPLVGTAGVPGRRDPRRPGRRAARHPDRQRRANRRG